MEIPSISTSVTTLKNKYEETNLFPSIKRSDIERVKFLIENGANINSLDELGWTPLHYAACKGDLGIVKFLIERGAQINPLNEEGETPLQNAIEQGNLEVAEFLVEKGAQINPLIKHKVYELATIIGDLDIIQFLEKLDRKERINRVSNGAKKIICQSRTSKCFSCSHTHFTKNPPQGILCKAKKWCAKLWKKKMGGKR